MFGVKAGRNVSFNPSNLTFTLNPTTTAPGEDTIGGEDTTGSEEPAVYNILPGYLTALFD